MRVNSFNELIVTKSRPSGRPFSCVVLAAGVSGRRPLSSASARTGRRPGPRRRPAAFVGDDLQVGPPCRRRSWRFDVNSRYTLLIAVGVDRRLKPAVGRSASEVPAAEAAGFGISPRPDLNIRPYVLQEWGRHSCRPPGRNAWPTIYITRPPLRAAFG